MGYYIDTPGVVKGKTFVLVEKHGGTEIEQPKSFKDIPADKALIVVVDNVVFEACGLAYSADEFEAFTLLTDHRPKRFVLLDKELA